MINYVYISYVKNKGKNTQNSILLNNLSISIIYAHEVINIYCVCIVEILHK